LGLTFTCPGYVLRLRPLPSPSPLLSLQVELACARLEAELEDQGLSKEEVVRRCVWRAPVCACLRVCMRSDIKRARIGTHIRACTLSTSMHTAHA